MNTQTPCSDYVETSGIIFFARMLDKVRLNAQGLLPAGYNFGVFRSHELRCPLLPLTCMTQTKAGPPDMPPGGKLLTRTPLGEPRVQRCIYGKNLLRARRVGLRSCATGVACLCKLTVADFARSPLY